MDTSQNLPPAGGFPSIPGRISEAQLKHTVRAKYIPQADGSMRLSCIQQMSQPVFSPDGYELIDSEKRRDVLQQDVEESGSPDTVANKLRATRRSRIAAMDLVLCNHDIDTFCTMTLDPKKIDRTSYSDCYEYLRQWLSNRVQRRGLKYICVPELHKDGEAVHFHSICNHDALQLTAARYPDSGNLIKHRRGNIRNQVYNITDWSSGFATAEIISGDNSRDYVAKYILKYMGKQAGQRIGGRYFLHGGQLLVPMYAYGDDPEEFADLSAAVHKKSVEITATTKFNEWSYI